MFGELEKDRANMIILLDASSSILFAWTRRQVIALTKLFASLQSNDIYHETVLFDFIECFRLARAAAAAARCSAGPLRLLSTQN